MSRRIVRRVRVRRVQEKRRGLFFSIMLVRRSSAAVLDIGPGSMCGVIKHATASAFVFRSFADGWRLGLVEHPVFDRHTVVGGHVEDGETPEEAAAREAFEESGYEVRILAPCGVTEFAVAGDNQLDEPHVHVDHHFVALAEDEPVRQPEHPFGWYAAHELDHLDMFDDSREHARDLLTQLPPAPYADDRRKRALDP